MRSAARPSVAPAATAKAASRNPSVAQSQQTIPLFDQDDHPSVPTWLTRQTPFDPDYPVKQHEVRAAGRCACTYSHSVPVTDVLASIPWYSSLAVHSGCCAPIPDLAAGASERGPPTNGQGFLAGR